jgi:O-methyltransferase domain/Dimerisation domain
MSERAPEALLWDFLRGAMMTQALAIACDLGIPHALAEGPRHVDDLASESGVDGDALHRVLRALASDGVFAEEDDRVFANTAASGLVRADAWTSFAHLFGGVFYGAVADLPRAVRDGKGTFAETFGAEFWPWLASRPEERGQFDRAMAGNKDRHTQQLAALDWRDGEVVVDVGGGNGALLVELLRREPNVRGIVFDLPETDRDESAFPDRLEFVEGSFFERVPPGDTYLLSGILHDWDDGAAAAICRTIHAAATSAARLLIVESVIAPGNEPEGAKWLDLLMLVLAGGRERTAAQWQDLLGSTGFDIEQIENGLIQARCR